MKRFSELQHDGWKAVSGNTGRELAFLLVCLFSLPLPVWADDLMPLFQTASSERGESANPNPASRTATPPASTPTPAPPEPKMVPAVKQQPLSPAASQQSAPAETDFDPEELQRQKDLRFRELRRQLEVLNQLSQQPVAPPSTREEFKQPLPLTKDTEQEPRSEDGDAASGTSAHRTDLHQEGSAKAPSRMPGESASVEGGGAGPAPALVVEGVVDRFALATSLFATGQTELCLDVLKHTDLKQLSREDQIWAEYLHACCHRRAGRIDLAQQSYRRILAEKDADWIGQLARWWLDELDAKAKLTSDIARLAETLSAWEAEIDTLGKQATTRTAAAQ